jgi:hypothetical protein
MVFIAFLPSQRQPLHPAVHFRHLFYHILRFHFLKTFVCGEYRLYKHRPVVPAVPEHPVRLYRVYHPCCHWHGPREVFLFLPRFSGDGVVYVEAHHPVEVPRRIIDSGEGAAAAVPMERVKQKTHAGADGVPQARAHRLWYAQRDT